MQKNIILWPQVPRKRPACPSRDKVKHNSVQAMFNIANYYYNVKKDHVNAEKYYIMAIEHGNIDAMNNLAVYYKNIKNHANAEKYYLMAIDHGCVNALNNLALYYEYTEKDMIKLVELYIKNFKLVDRNKIINEIKKIWNLDLDSEQSVRLVELLSTFEILPDDNIPTSLRMFINMLQQNIDTMRLHFEYTLNGKGYEEAKEDFISLIANS
jgi:tetratricopeptide (TPR) repeat protein